MNPTFAEILAALGAGFAIRIANAIRPAANYLFASILPERNRPTYFIENGSITIRPTMAGLVAMDAPYPPGGVIQAEKFMEQSAKIANTFIFPEKALRELQLLVQQTNLNGGNANQLLVQTVFNFTGLVLVQAHIDTFEWLRSQALTTGKIIWTFNGLELNIDYGIPADHIFDTRTTASGQAYGAASSTFWADHRAAMRKLKYNVREIIMHPDTYDEIVFNEANKIEVLSQTNSVFRIRRLIGNNERPSTDFRDGLTIRTYAEEGEALDPVNPNATVHVSYMPKGKILYVGRNNASGFRLGGEGAVQPTENELGYTHIAPTVEGNGAMGRWARVYTPEGRPMQLKGDGVTNGLPVIEAPEKIVILSTEGV